MNYTTVIAVSPRVHVFHIHNKHYFFYIFIRLNTTIYYEHVSDNNNCIQPLGPAAERSTRSSGKYICVCISTQRKEVTSARSVQIRKLYKQTHWNNNAASAVCIVTDRVLNSVLRSSRVFSFKTEIKTSKRLNIV